MSMIHAICDFCGKDCDRTATLLSMTPFQNFARYHTDNEPYGNREKTRSFVICYECCKKHNLPNPYETYSGITKQEGHYEKCLDNYTDVDLVEDKKYDKLYFTIFHVFSYNLTKPYKCSVYQCFRHFIL